MDITKLDLNLLVVLHHLLLKKRVSAVAELLGMSQPAVSSALGRLRATLRRMASLVTERVDLKAPSPFSLPLMVERLREKLSTEKLADRLARIVRDAERTADKATQR